MICDVTVGCVEGECVVHVSFSGVVCRGWIIGDVLRSVASLGCYHTGFPGLDSRGGGAARSWHFGLEASKHCFCLISVFSLFQVGTGGGCTLVGASRCAGSCVFCGGGVTLCWVNVFNVCIMLCNQVFHICIFLFWIFHVPIFPMFLIFAVIFRKCHVSVFVHALHFELEASTHQVCFISFFEL